MTRELGSLDRQIPLPIFPNFEKLKLEHKKSIEDLTQNFEPYSDFNFTNLWAWDIDGSTLVSTLDGNLVLRLTDYDNGNLRFYTFLGNTELDKTARALINNANESGNYNNLMFVPEIVALNIKDELLGVSEERDNFDYVVSADTLSDLKGGNYSTKRRYAHKFLNVYGDKTEVRKLSIDEETVNDILQTFQNWREESHKSLSEVASELDATKRIIKNADHFPLNVTGIYLDGTMIAYCIFEIQGIYAIMHFEKALKSYVGIYDYLKSVAALRAHEQGVKYLNYEQDLGIPGLREAKMRLHPVKFLKKYSVVSKI